MLYLRFHQTLTPARITTSGISITLEYMIILIWFRLSASRLSSGSLGRIEIRSSSDESQLIMFRLRSRLPLNRIQLLAMKPDDPTTTTRPCDPCPDDCPVE